MLDGIERITGIRPDFVEADCTDIDALSNLFEQYPDVSVADDPFSVAEEGSAIFVENLRIDERLDSVSTLIIYRWNRKYPSDVKFNVDPVKCGFKLKSSVDFKGSSHEKITKEIYER